MSLGFTSFVDSFCPLVVLWLCSFLAGYFCLHVRLKKAIIRATSSLCQENNNMDQFRLLNKTKQSCLCMDKAFFKMSNHCALCKVNSLATQLATVAVKQVKCSDSWMGLTFCIPQLIVNCSTLDKWKYSLFSNTIKRSKTTSILNLHWFHF